MKNGRLSNTQYIEDSNVSIPHQDSTYRKKNLPPTTCDPNTTRFSKNTKLKQKENLKMAGQVAEKYHTVKSM